MKLLSKPNRRRGFTLAEVVVSLAIAALLFGGVLKAYIQFAQQSEWSGYSLAAQALATQQIEQACSAVWDFSLNKNQLTNLTLLASSYNAGTRTLSGYATNVLDLPQSGTNIVVATNFVTVKLLNLSGFANAQVQMVRVDTVWPFETYRGRRYFTNTTATYFGPDNRDDSGL